MSFISWSLCADTFFTDHSQYMCSESRQGLIDLLCHNSLPRKLKISKHHSILLDSNYTLVLFIWTHFGPPTCYHIATDCSLQLFYLFLCLTSRWRNFGPLWRRADNFMSMLITYGYWAGRALYRATTALTSQAAVVSSEVPPNPIN